MEKIYRKLYLQNDKIDKENTFRAIAMLKGSNRNGNIYEDLITGKKIYSCDYNPNSRKDHSLYYVNTWGYNILSIEEVKSILENMTKEDIEAYKNYITEIENITKATVIEEQERLRKKVEDEKEVNRILKRIRKK